MKLTALSFPIEGKPCIEEGSDAVKNKGEACLYVFVKLMQTFFAPVLPYDFGFAVIDDHTGEVYYHSNDQRSLLENFYIETDRNAKLISAVRSRRSQFVSGIYNAQPHRFYISPLDGAPWSLVVFYDLSSIEIANLRSLLVSLIYSALVVLLLLAISLVTRLMFPGRVFKPLKTFLPNGELVLRLRSRLKTTGVGRIADNGFDVIYVASAMLIVFIVFGMIAWFTFSDVKQYQIARMQRFNLLHIGQAILKRMDFLMLEQQRLEIKQSCKLPIRYADLLVDDQDSKFSVLISDFAIYYPHDFKLEDAWYSGTYKCRSSGGHSKTSLL